MNEHLAIKTLLGKYERFFAPLAFIAGLGILIVNSFHRGRFRFSFLEPYAEFLTLPIQFAFGGLFSGFFIFYSRSADIATSWPFLLFLAALLFGNEFFRKRYTRLIFQLNVFFIALFSYAIFALPIVLGRMGAEVFLLSGLLSIAAMALFLFLLSAATRDSLREHKRAAFAAIGRDLSWLQPSLFCQPHSSNSPLA